MRAPAPKRSDKRYGWWRCYNDLVGHPKWRLVASRSSVPLVEVTAIAMLLLQVASKAKPRGSVGDFDHHEAAIALDIAPESVAAVYRTLVGAGWIDRGVIVDWYDRQPDQEDPTAAERQRQRRARVKAARAFALGVATAEQAALLTRPEQEAALHLAQAALDVPASSQPPRPTEELVLLDGDTPEVAAENLARARRWLVGDADALVGYGPASAIVAERLRQRRMNADLTVRGWMREVDDPVAVARIIAGAAREGIDEGFEAVVRQRIAALVDERRYGPPLRLGPAMMRGGRDVA